MTDSDNSLLAIIILLLTSLNNTYTNNLSENKNENDKVKVNWLNSFIIN